jgi:SAM-dependent methyltransferase
MPSRTDTFEANAAVYDLLIDWPKRLANEEPFYRRVFERLGVRRVLDAACGTGRHAALFHSWGLEVEGADLSAGMIAECRMRFGEPPGLRWVVRPFDMPPVPAALPPFDVVICVGNSLALAGDTAVVERAVAAMLSAVRSGGACIIQVLNLWSLPENTTIWQKCKRVTHAGADHVLLKSIRRVGSQGHIDFADLTLSDDGGVTSRFDAAEFLGLESDDLTRMATSAGAGEVQVFGSYRQEPYDRATSPDLILVACRW